MREEKESDEVKLTPLITVTSMHTIVDYFNESVSTFNVYELFNVAISLQLACAFGNLSKYLERWEVEENIPSGFVENDSANKKNFKLSFCFLGGNDKRQFAVLKFGESGSDVKAYLQPCFGKQEIVSVGCEVPIYQPIAATYHTSDDDFFDPEYHTEFDTPLTLD